jgi:hypothetical integral membrane protein (TIGR02206 family)
MNWFFTGEPAEYPFIPYSPSHIITLLALVLCNIILVVWFQRAQEGRAVKGFRLGLASFLLFTQVGFIAWCVLTGNGSVDYSLPFHLCDMAALLTALMLFSDRYHVFDLIYFWGLGGSLQALLTPDVAYPFPHLVFFIFFLGHGALLTAIFFMIWVKKYRPTFKSVLRTFIITNLYMVLVAGVNVITGGNYMFICRPPVGTTLISYLGPWPWYILSLEGVGLAIFLLCYSPYAITDFLKRKKASGFFPSSGNRGLPM